MGKGRRTDGRTDHALEAHLGGILQYITVGDSDTTLTGPQQHSSTPAVHNSEFPFQQAFSHLCYMEFTILVLTQEIPCEKIVMYRNNGQRRVERVQPLRHKFSTPHRSTRRGGTVCHPPTYINMYKLAKRGQRPTILFEYFQRF